MLSRFQNLFGRKKAPRPTFTEEQYIEFQAKKEQGLQRVLGEMYHLVQHAILPFQVGGAVDMYYFPDALDGTAFATMELIEPDGSGPKPSRIGAYELVAFTKLAIGDESRREQFQQIERRMCGIFTTLGHHAREVQLNPLETVEVHAEGEPNRCLILDAYAKPGTPFTIGDQKHGLLLVMEVLRSEMDYARKHGAAAVLAMLKEQGHYPYSDLDREAVV
ncbi:MAG: suppressor of fused domain protein [Chloroflexi bacterium]|nr:suppressor of fused domain protein [Chloroflexota bacterium]